MREKNATPFLPSLFGLPSYRTPWAGRIWKSFVDPLFCCDVVFRNIANPLSMVEFYADFCQITNDCTVECCNTGNVHRTRVRLSVRSHHSSRAYFKNTLERYKY